MCLSSGTSLVGVFSRSSPHCAKYDPSFEFIFLERVNNAGLKALLDPFRQNLRTDVFTQALIEEVIKLASTEEPSSWTRAKPLETQTFSELIPTDGEDWDLEKIRGVLYVHVFRNEGLSRVDDKDTSVDSHADTMTDAGPWKVSLYTYIPWQAGLICTYLFRSTPVNLFNGAFSW